MSDENTNLPNEAIASIKRSGVLANLKDVSFNVASSSDHDSISKLMQEAQSTIAAIKQLLDGSNPNIGVSEKLKTALLDLQSALAKGTVSRAALETALAEAAGAMSGADGNGQSATAQQIEAQLWQRVVSDNIDIDDDFTKMRKAGIVFNANLWNKHKQLMEQLQAHPHDIVKQKELDAVDDAMLMQAEPQLKHHPDAKGLFEDAKKKSEDRHQAVDVALAKVAKKQSASNEISMADFDAEVHGQDGTLNMNDVGSPLAGHKPKSSGKQHT